MTYLMTAFAASVTSLIGPPEAISLTSDHGTLESLNWRDGSRLPVDR